MRNTIKVLPVGDNGCYFVEVNGAFWADFGSKAQAERFAQEVRDGKHND